MAITERQAIKNWFIRSAMPTRLQFWAWLDSFWHKNDQMPIDNVEGLVQILAEINLAMNNAAKFKGYFTSASSLQAAHPSPQIGDTAWVGIPYPGVVYKCNVAGVWLATTDTPQAPVINLADYAKITDVAKKADLIRITDNFKVVYSETGEMPQISVSDELKEVIPFSSTGATVSNATFYYLNQDSLRGQFINQIRLNVSVAGLLTIIIAKDINTPTFERLRSLNVMVTGIGEQIINIPSIFLLKNEFLGIGETSDSCKFLVNTTTSNPVAGGYFYQFENTTGVYPKRDITIGVSVLGATTENPSDLIARTSGNDITNQLIASLARATINTTTGAIVYTGAYLIADRCKLKKNTTYTVVGHNYIVTDINPTIYLYNSKTSDAASFKKFNKKQGKPFTFTTDDTNIYLAMYIQVLPLYDSLNTIRLIEGNTSVDLIDTRNRAIKRNILNDITASNNLVSKYVNVRAYVNTQTGFFSSSGNVYRLTQPISVLEGDILSITGTLRGATGVVGYDASMRYVSEINPTTGFPKSQILDVPVYNGSTGTSTEYLINNYEVTIPTGILFIQVSMTGTNDILITKKSNPNILENVESSSIGEKVEEIDKNVNNIIYRSGNPPRSQKTHQMCGHRGLRIGAIPENSLSAIAFAAKCGLHSVEIDCSTTSDGNVILLHDDNFARVATSNNPLIPTLTNSYTLTLEEIQNTFTYISTNAAYRTVIPSIREVADLCYELNITPIFHIRLLGYSMYTIKNFVETCNSRMGLYNFIIAPEPPFDDVFRFLYSNTRMLKVMYNANPSESEVQTMFDNNLGYDSAVLSYIPELVKRFRQQSLDTFTYDVTNKTVTKCIKDKISFIAADYVILDIPHKYMINKFSSSKISDFTNTGTVDGTLITLPVSTKLTLNNANLELLEYGGITVKLEAVGKFTISGNFAAEEENTNKQFEHYQFGNIFINAKPTFVLTAVTEVKIKSLDIEVGNFK
ncbi:glycerophosphodiester phosphodiesterase family protein [Dysgonomonas sp. HGC4]|uniref:glycerophosphodiester phosphodiesterase family protein n=1 Tax=Dysgonomonas sp. HGC4 TaxID=1658009 RepID=UPI000680D74D|nr:glycerophosphodiester phosphodiesterase family protein [Dysgonomonas sp. HGC4]MBD8348568.1 hypothetical protein [Dysgonomonas sp. HGC4]